jgi:hypothetical protein
MDKENCHPPKAADGKLIAAAKLALAAKTVV